MAEQLSFPFAKEYRRARASGPYPVAAGNRWKKYDVALDFDGVLHANVAKWTKPSEVNDVPTEGALEAVQLYERAGLNLIVFSARANDAEATRAIRTWLRDNGFPAMPITAKKVDATIYVDDRGYHFNGNNWPSVESIIRFTPWNRKELSND